MRSIDALPPELSGLYPRQRELVSIIYARGGATLHEMRSEIPDSPGPRGLRTLLERLTRKGIVRQRRSGRHTEILYLPALITRAARLSAFDRLVEDHFSGSRAKAAEALATLAGLETLD